MTKKVFVYIWEYLVKEEYTPQFEKVYGPEGDWVQLFKKSKGHIATDLHQDIANTYRYMTVDTWNSKEDRDSFRTTYSKEFENLDAHCERFMEKEELIGEFYSDMNRSQRFSKQTTKENQENT